MRITLKDIFNIPTSEIYNPDLYNPVTSVSIDSRTIKRNSLFVAIKGKNFDGHKFVNDAIGNGAKAVVVNRKNISQFEDLKIPVIAVNNTLDAYSELAKIWRRKFKGKVISLTGSNGKTTTKEILAHLLSAKYKVHKTFANNNNQIGVPLTILTVPRSADFMVLEHGTNHFGEIEYTAKIASPDIALITNIGTSHTQYLESKEKILEEKIQLLKNCVEEGTVFINNDDPLISKRKGEFKNKITYGFKGRCDIKAEIVGSNNVLYKKLKIKGLGEKFESELPLLGESNLQNFLSAAAVAVKVGLSGKDIAKQSKTLKSVKGRLELLKCKDFHIIDDTYNSNPDSLGNALRAVSGIGNDKTKVLILGDMFELGEDAPKFHTAAGKMINKIKHVEVYTIGKNSKKINEALKGNIIQKHFATRNSLLKFIDKMDFHGSVVLVKGSRGMHMEDFVNEIKDRA